jgi:rod shape determining protein RodA
VVRQIPVLAYDWSLALLTLLINALGLVVLRTAVPTAALWDSQLIWTVLAISLAVGLQFLSRHQVLKFRYVLYAATLFFLLAVLVVGHRVNGAKAWFIFGPIRLQPSELAKFALVLALAPIVARRPLRRLSDYLLPLALTLPLVVLVIIEPDLGQTAVLLSGLLGILFVRGLPLKHIVVAVLCAGLLIPTVVWPHLKPYQKQRIEIVFNPQLDPLGAGFQVIQSQIAIGSGGLWGKGYGRGTQIQYGFVPERQTDFIFSALAEQWGFIGSIGLMLLYFLFFWRLGQMVLECPRLEDRLIISGVLAMLAFQVLINVGVTLGLAPVTGITLPFFSYGGSSLITTYLSLGLVSVVHRDRLLP